MKHRRWKWLLVIVCGIPLLVCGLDRCVTTHWVGGSTDLEIEFAITDAAASRPIPGAWIEVQSWGAWDEETQKQEFVLVADIDGVVRKECGESKCFGSYSGLRFTDRLFVHLPRWVYRAVADGYDPGDWAYLGALHGPVQRAGPGKAKLFIPLSLRRSTEPKP
jgi:hypothetical protein